jgi:hypothetical protein
MSPTSAIRHPIPSRHARRRAALGISILGLTILGACGGSDSPTAPPAPTHGVRLTNSSSRVVNAVYVSSCTADTWGDNKLTGTLAPLGVKIFAVTTPGCYDIRVVATDGHSWRRDDIPVQGTTGVKVE